MLMKGTDIALRLEKKITHTLISRKIKTTG